MSRLLLVLFAVSTAFLYLFLLGWSGSSYLSYASGKGELSLTPQEIRPLSLGESLTLEIQGRGFDQSTRAQLQLDTGSRDAIVSTFPLDGVANDMLLENVQIFLATTQGGLQLFDISNPTAPEYIRSYLPRVSVLDIEKNGNKYILSCASQGLYIFEEAKEKILTEVRRLYSVGVALESRVVGNYLYVAAGVKGLLVYDLTNEDDDRPQNIIDPGSLLLGLETFGDRLYLATRNAGVQVYQIQGQGRLHYLGRVAEDKVVRDLKRHQDKLYLIESGRVSLYHLGSSPLPELLEAEIFSGSTQDLHLVDGMIYVADSYNGINRLAQKSDGYSSTGYIDVGGMPRAMASKGAYLYVAASQSGLKIVDQRAVLPRQTKVVLNTVNMANDLYVRDGRLYATDRQGGLQSVGINQQEPPVAQLSNDGSMGLAVSADWLYVAKKSRGVEIFDITDHTSVSSIANLPDLGAVNALAKLGQYLVLAKGAAGLVLVDVADLRKPLVVDEFAAVHAIKVEVQNGLIYVAGDRTGVLIFRVTEQGRFEQLGKIVPPFPLDGFSAAQEVRVQKGIAYVANGSGGLLIVDVRDPRKPKIISSIALPGLASSLAIDGSRVYVACRKSGLQVVDVSDLENPQLEASLAMFGLESGIQIADGMIYLGNGYTGVTAIPVPQQLSDLRVLSSEKLRIRVPSPEQPGRYRLQVSNKKQTAVLSGALQYQAVQNL